MSSKNTVWGYVSLNLEVRYIRATSDPSICRVHQALWRRRVETWMQVGYTADSLREKVTLHLHVVFSGLPKCFQPELPLARVDCRRRSDAGALAPWSGRDGLHGVEVLRAGTPFFYSSAGALAQGSDNTFTPTVRAFGEGFHFVIITQQLQREEDGCIFHHVFQCMNFYARNIEMSTYHTEQRGRMDVGSYLRKNVLLAGYLLLEPLVSLHIALKL